MTTEPRTSYYFGDDLISEREFLALTLQGRDRLPRYSGDSKVEATYHNGRRPAVPVYSPPVVVPVPEKPAAELDEGEEPMRPVDWMLATVAAVFVLALGWVAIVALWSIFS